MFRFIRQVYISLLSCNAIDDSSTEYVEYIKHIPVSWISVESINRICFFVFFNKTYLISL